MPGFDPGIHSTAEKDCPVTPGNDDCGVLIMPGLDPGILSSAIKKDRRVKPGDDE
jgi:hypothetical protein